MKILIIDDEQLIVRALELGFKKKGHHVYSAYTAAEGLSLWKKIQPEFVFLDYMLPDHNADFIIQEIGDLSNVKVVIMSAYTGDNLVQDSLPGIKGFLKKPFQNIFEVYQMVEALT